MARPKGPCNALELEQRRAAAKTARPRRRPSRWKGETLLGLRIAYEEMPRLPVNDIAAFYGTSRGHLMRLAKQHGWKRRQADWLPAAAHDNWNLYRKVHRIAGRAVALEAVAGVAQ